MKRRTHAAIAALVLASLSGGTLAADVAVTYSLVPELDDGVTARGQIELRITNVSARALDDVSVRLVVPGQGQLEGPVLDAVDLAVGEATVWRGDFAWSPEFFDAGGPIAWRVSHRNMDGTIQEHIVTGEQQD